MYLIYVWMVLGNRHPSSSFIEINAYGVTKRIVQWLSPPSSALMLLQMR